MQQDAATIIERQRSQKYSTARKKFKANLISPIIPHNLYLSEEIY